MSYWSSGATGTAAWNNREDFLLSWVLSSGLLHRWFKETQLVTDTAGKQLLLDDLGLQFDSVLTTLDDLKVPPGLWSLGKIMAHSIQDEPFIHIDHDVFLWDKLPDRILAAPVAAWAPERHAYTDARSAYDLNWMAQHLVVKPKYFDRYIRRDVILAINCGLFGGHALSCIRDFALDSLRVASHPANLSAWDKMRAEQGSLFKATLFLEQYLPGLSVLAHKQYFEYLYHQNADSAYIESPYAHLLGHQKRLAHNALVMRDAAALCSPDKFTKIVGGLCDPAHYAGSCAGKNLIILGSGAGLWAEFDQARALLGQYDIMAINLTYFALESLRKQGIEKLTHWAGVHPDFFDAFRNRRDGILTHSPRQGICADPAMRGVDVVWNLHTLGTSGQFATKVGCLLGYDRIILCGMPLDSGRKFYDHPQASCHEIKMDGTWNVIKSLAGAKIRSMSGKTAELFGKPTHEWVHNKISAS